MRQVSGPIQAPARRPAPSQAAPRDPVVNRRTFISVVTVSLLAAPGGAEGKDAASCCSRADSHTPFPRGGIQTGARRVRVHGRTKHRNRVQRRRRQTRAAVPARGRPRSAQRGCHLSERRGALSAAKQATSRIPIVAVDLESDPVAVGFVRNLARPGGNITGVFLDLPELSGKQLQLLKEIIRPLSRVAVLGDPVLNAPQLRRRRSPPRRFCVHRICRSW